MCLMYVCYLFQGKKCFCGKSDKCPTIGESIESVSLDTNKVCVSYCCALVYVIMCYYCRMVEVLLDRVRLCLLVIMLVPRRLRYVVYFCVCDSVNICCVVGWMEVFWPEW